MLDSTGIGEVEKEKGQVGGELDRLRIAVDRLKESLSNFEERLSGVTQQSTPDIKETAVVDASQLVPLADEIRIEGDRIENLVKRLTDLRNRIEL